MVSMGRAARMTGKSKPTISRAIRSGKLSASPNGSGGYRIDPAELVRVFAIRNPDAGTDNGHMKPSVTPAVPPVEPGDTALREQIVGLQGQLELMRGRLDDTREQMRERVDELREQRDGWQEQARTAQRMLADARMPRRSWFGLRRA